jgi:hypothetical protein
MRALHHPIPVLGLLCAALLPLAGCGPAPRAILDKHREAAERKLEHLHSAVQQVRQRPLLEKDTNEGAAASEPVFGSGTDLDDPANAHVLFEADCQPAPATVDDLEDRKIHYRDEWWALPERALRLPEAGLKKTSADRLDRLFRRLSRARYVLIVRQRSLDRPKEDNGLAGTSFFTFHKGTFTGEAHLFDLDQPKCLCAFRFTAHNSDQPVMLTEQNREDFLMTDLLNEAERTAQVQLGQWAPQRKSPWK